MPLLKEIGREHAIFWLGLGCGISSCLDAITNQQTDLIVAALVIAGCGALMRGRDLRAGIWFGLAAALKCTPLLWAGYLAWRRQPRRAALSSSSLPSASIACRTSRIPPPAAHRALAEWTGRFLLPMTARAHEFGAWNCGVGGNQSIAGIWQRWLDYDTAWHGHNLVGVHRPSGVRPETLKAVSWGTMLLLLAAGLACSWRAHQSPSASEGSALEFGMVLILMVLLSPHSSKPPYCTLLLPGVCVARAALYWPPRRLLSVLSAAVLLALASNQDLVGEWLYSWTKWHGSLAWCALLLYAASCRVLWQSARATTVETSTIGEWQPLPQVG